MRDIRIWAGDLRGATGTFRQSVEMVALLAMPLLLRSARIWDAGCGKWACVFVAVSLVIQVASLAFWLPLEIYQMETFGHPTFVIALRFKNIVAFALGKMDAWGLNTDDMGLRPVGLRAYHDLELSSHSCCEACRSGTAVGRGCDVCRVGDGAGGTRKRFVGTRTST